MPENKSKIFIEKLERHGIVKLNFKSKNISWIKAGGLIKTMFIPYSEKDLQIALNYILSNKIYTKNKILTVGRMSNLLIRDGGFDGLCIFLKNDNFTTFKVMDENGNELNHSKKDKLSIKKGFDVKEEFDLNNGFEVKIEVGSFVKNLDLANLLAKIGISGLEFISTIPGTIGGGLAMNAGCNGLEFKDVLLKVRSLCLDSFKIEELGVKEIDFKYRESSLNGNKVILGGTFLGKYIGNQKELICQKMKDMNDKRIKTQPYDSKTLGSTFKNPNGFSAWELIDKAGLMGFKIGGAMFSDKHPNFITNCGDCTAQDVEELIMKAKLSVKKMFDIELEEEIKIIGSNSK